SRREREWSGALRPRKQERGGGLGTSPASDCGVAALPPRRSQAQAGRGRRATCPEVARRVRAQRQGRCGAAAALLRSWFDALPNPLQNVAREVLVLDDRVEPFVNE